MEAQLWHQLGKYPCNVCNFLKDNPASSFVPDRNLNLQCVSKIPSKSDWCQCLGFLKCIMYNQDTTKPIYLSPNEVFFFFNLLTSWLTDINWDPSAQSPQALFQSFPNSVTHWHIGQDQMSQVNTLFYSASVAVPNWEAVGVCYKEPLMMCLFKECISIHNYTQYLHWNSCLLRFLLFFFIKIQTRSCTSKRYILMG